MLRRGRAPPSGGRAAGAAPPGAARLPERQAGALQPRAGYCCVFFTFPFESTSMAKFRKETFSKPFSLSRW